MVNILGLLPTCEMFLQGDETRVLFTDTIIDLFHLIRVFRPKIASVTELFIYLLFIQFETHIKEFKNSDADFR